MNDDFPWSEKLRATGVHFCLSALAVGSLLALAILSWYPEFLFGTDGGWEGLRIVVLVDLVLGPLLTFVVFRRGKKGLLLDLSPIAALQLAALLGGGWVVYSERPLALVLYEGRVFSVTAGEYQEAGVPVPDFSALPGRPPAIVAFAPPEDPLEQSPVRTAYLGRQQPLYSHAPWMAPLDEHIEDIAAAARGRDTLEETDADRERLAAWLADQGRTFEEVAFVPYSSRFALIHLGVDPGTGRVLGALETRSKYD